jgi:hypothetical protein
MKLNGHLNLIRLAAALAALAGLAVSVPAQAGADITVNTTSDVLTPGGPCSLRAAILAADTQSTASGSCTTGQAGENEIVLGPGVYKLTIPGSNETGDKTGDLNVFGNIDVGIVGQGEGVTTIDASGLTPVDRVMSIASGSTVQMHNLTVTGGHAPDGTGGTAGANSSSGDGGAGGPGGAGENGGGILNAGTLTLDHVAVTDNLAGNAGDGGRGGDATGPTGNGGAGGAGGAGGLGAGVYNSGTANVENSTFSHNNNIPGPGGGSFVGGDGGSGAQGGKSTDGTGGKGGASGASGDGGGVYNTGTVVVDSTTIDDNYAAGDDGSGGFGGNGTPGAAGGAGSAGGWGGGVASVGGSVSVSNSTIVANRAGRAGNGGDGGTTNNDLQAGGAGGNAGDGGNGGGVWIQDPPTLPSPSVPVLLGDTITGNQTGSPGDIGDGGNAGGIQGPNGKPGTPGISGGVFDQPTSPFDRSKAVVLQNTLLASDAGGNCGGGRIVDGGLSLSFPATDGSCPSTLASGDPMLGSLADNGGPTQTIALQAGSAAIDQIPATGAGCPQTDQRGVPRPQPAGGECDIGAYEYAPPKCQPVSTQTQAGTPVTVQLSCADPAGVAVTYAIVSAPAHGTLSGLDATQGTVTYTPSAGYSGPDSFTYGASSSNGTSSPQTVSITVNPPPGGSTGGGSSGGGSSGGGSSGGGSSGGGSSGGGSSGGGSSGGGTSGGGTGHGPVPAISAARLTHNRFRVGARATAVTARRNKTRRAPIGTTIRFTLSTAARLVITFTRPTPGRLRGNTCVAPTKRLIRSRAKRCTRQVFAGKLVRASEPQGPDAVSFSGRVGSRALRPGVYRASLQASNTDGASRPVMLRFSILEAVGGHGSRTA